MSAATHPADAPLQGIPHATSKIRFIRGRQQRGVIDAAEWAKLPKPFQQAFEVAAAEVNLNMMAEYDSKNPLALKRLVANGVSLQRYPVDLLRSAQKAAFEFYEEEAGRDTIRSPTPTRCDVDQDRVPNWMDSR